MENAEYRKLQFIKNFNGSMACKPFRKYAIVDGWYSKACKHWVHYTEKGIHFIPCEFVKIYKH